MAQEEHWTYYPWKESASVSLKFADLVETQPSPPNDVDQLPDFVAYADMSYLACRILMISSTRVHPPALYMASQTIEKYMKVLLLGFNEKVPYKHDLTELARLVHKALVDNGLEPSTTDLFSDKEFLKLCEHLNKFQIGGRYPPKDMAGWAYSLNLLAFLDEFVVQCRSMVDLERGTPNMVAELLSQDTKDNSVMAAAVTAVLDNNRQVDALINPLL